MPGDLWAPRGIFSPEFCYELAFRAKRLESVVQSSCRVTEVQPPPVLVVPPTLGRAVFEDQRFSQPVDRPCRVPGSVSVTRIY
jgi:hypothetical protein